MSGTAIVWEGQFKNDNLEGFGRYIKITLEGIKTTIIGFFKDGMPHGYCKKQLELDAQEGLFENNEYVKKKEMIKSYDVENDVIARKVDFKKYIV